MSGYQTKIRELAWDAGSRYLANGGADGCIYIWNLEKALRHRHELLPPSPIAALAWSPDDTALAIGSADGIVRVLERGDT